MIYLNFNFTFHSRRISSLLTSDLKLDVVVILLVILFGKYASEFPKLGRLGSDSTIVDESVLVETLTFNV